MNSNNSKKNFKQATISSFFQSPKNKNEKNVNEKNSFSNVNLSQFKKVRENQRKRSASNSNDIISSTTVETENNFQQNKKRNIYKNYHHALQKFKFNTINNEMNIETTVSETNINNTSLISSNDKIQNNNCNTKKMLKDISKYSSSITSLQPRIANKSREKINYTPLELQYINLKEKYPNILLAIEVGYKYRFFDEDAM
eukprot:jgi/Orpsp1_1/1181355/evm.model.c7180000076932.1